MKVNGERYYLWRAIDLEVEVPVNFVTKRRCRHAATNFLKKAIKRFGRQVEIITDQLCSNAAALKEMGAPERQTTGQFLNNMIENSRLPFRRWERAMSRFRRMRSLQKFVSVHASVFNYFNHELSLNKRDKFNHKADLAE